MKRRFLGIALTVCMALLLMPVSVQAEETETQELQRLITTAIYDGSGILKLEKDYTITTTALFNGNFTLDLNGHVIRLDNPTEVHSVICASNGVFTLKDSDPTAQHSGSYADLPAGGVITGARMDGTIGGHHGEGGGVLSTVKFIMEGGTIYDCRAALGGGVSARVFIMNGGTISNCYAKDVGGGVYVSMGSFTMNGGTISNCSAPEGGGVLLYYSQRLLTHGVIENCTSSDGKSDAMYIQGNTTLSVGGTINGTVLSEGTIQENTTAESNTAFNGTVYNRGTISYGTYYGGIVNEGGTVNDTYYTVSFDLNGGSGSTPVTQWFVNISDPHVLQPSDPVNGNYTFMGWYDGDHLFNFNETVNRHIALQAQWKDTGYPVITGIEDGKTYCDTVEFEVSDNIGVTGVTVKNETITPDNNGKYTLRAGIGKVTVVAADAEGNRTEIKVTVNNGHTGGTATCSQKAICDICEEEYGECDSTNHNLEKIPAKDATVTETGNKEYWHCPDCGKYFADENGINEIKLADTVIAKLPPEIIEGKGQSITEGEKKELTFRSNAAFGDFIRAQLDGKTLDAANYTVKEGSTVVTLKADYVATLSAGGHTIGIVSESGTATATFTVNAKAANNNKSPQTGDNSHMALWVALLFASGGLLTVTGVYSKKKNHSES